MALNRTSRAGGGRKAGPTKDPAATDHAGRETSVRAAGNVAWWSTSGPTVEEDVRRCAPLRHPFRSGYVGSLTAGVVKRLASPSRGNGPRGYARADADIASDVAARLSQRPDLDAADVAVRVERGVVFLSGHVGDAAGKRRAGVCAGNVTGVVRVANALAVRSDV